MTDTIRTASSDAWNGAESNESGSKESGSKGSGIVVVGIALGLMLLAALAVFLIAFRGGPIDGAQVMEAEFGTRALPFDLVIESAEKLPAGQRLVRWRNPNALEEAPPPKPVEAPREEKPMGAMGGPPAFDWSKISLGETGKPPREVLFLFVEERNAKGMIAELFDNVQWRDLRDIGAEGGRAALDAAKIGWRGFDANYVHERSYENGGTFRDAMRANLSLPGRPCVMIAVWSRGEQASKTVFEQLLAALEG